MKSWTQFLVVLVVFFGELLATALGPLVFLEGEDVFLVSFLGDDVFAFDGEDVFLGEFFVAFFSVVLFLGEFFSVEVFLVLFSVFLGDEVFLDDGESFFAGDLEREVFALEGEEDVLTFLDAGEEDLDREVEDFRFVAVDFLGASSFFAGDFDREALLGGAVRTGDLEVVDLVVDLLVEVVDLGDLLLPRCVSPSEESSDEESLFLLLLFEEELAFLLLNASESL